MIRSQNHPARRGLLQERLQPTERRRARAAPQEAVPHQSSASHSRVESCPERTHVVVRSSPQCDSTPRETFGHDLSIPKGVGNGSECDVSARPVGRRFRWLATIDSDGARTRQAPQSFLWARGGQPEIDQGRALESATCACWKTFRQPGPNARHQKAPSSRHLASITIRVAFPPKGDVGVVSDS